MSKYGYLVITTKSFLSEAEHTKILSFYGQQGYRLVEQKKNGLGRTTYTLERATEVQKVVSEISERPGFNSRAFLLVPHKYLYEITEVLLKGIEASGKELRLEAKEVLLQWIALNRPDLGKRLKSGKDKEDSL
jgi:hypothetical protein